MSIIDELITDRTQADVDRQLELNAKWIPGSGVFAGTYEEQQEWLAGTKGTYRAADLNRVGKAIHYIAERLQAAGYDVSVFSVTDFTNADWVDPAYANMLLGEIRQLRGKFSQTAQTPQVPASMENMTVQTANDIEKNLAAIDRLLTNMTAARYFGGEVYSGEV